ncbi:MAG: patatin-like phospholipase family protein [Candidatus Buchananbacteria bacterium]|nr:patatin-like phospholipase family protein [Candidatus Buchananbacteria bacterium]
MSENISRKKVGLALSGGFIRATAQIGVIEVLEENNIPIDIISGCSSGSAIAGAYAAGTLPQLKKRLIEGRRRDFWRVIFEPTIPREGFLKGERNRVFFEEFVGDKEFKDLHKKVLLTVTDILTMKETIIADGKVGQAIQACTAVPGVFKPVKRGGQVLVDGGNFNMIPSNVLYQNGADYVIAVYVSRPPSLFTRFFSTLRGLKKNKKEAIKNHKTNLNIIDLIYRASWLSVAQSRNFYHTAYPYNIIIDPGIKHIGRMHTSAVKYCIQEGRRAALRAVPQIKKDLGL